MKKILKWTMSLIVPLLLAYMLIGSLCHSATVKQGTTGSVYVPAGVSQAYVDSRFLQEAWVGDQRFGTAPDKTGATDTAAYFSALITTIGSTNTTLVVPRGTYKVSADLTFPANIAVKFLKGAVFKPTSVAGAGTATNADVSATGTITVGVGGTTVTRSSSATPVETGTYLVADPGGGEERREIKDRDPAHVGSGYTTPEIWTAFSGALTTASYKVSSRTISFSGAHGLEVNDRVVVGAQVFRVLTVPAADSITTARHPATAFAAQAWTRGVRVQFNGPVQADRQQAFDTSGYGVIKFARGVVDAVLPEWFGAVGDGSTDSARALNESMWPWAPSPADQPYALQGTVKLGVGKYVLGDTLYYPAYVNLKGVKASSDLRSGSILILATNVNRHLIDALPVGNIATGEWQEIEDLTFHSGSQTVAVHGVSINQTVGDFRIKNCRFYGFVVNQDNAYGVYANSGANLISFCKFASVSNGIYLGTDSKAAFNDIAFLRRYGIHTEASDGAIVGNKVYSDNLASGCTTVGLFIKGASRLTVQGNVFDHNDYNVHIYNGGGVFNGNIITSARSHGVHLEYLLNNFIFQGNYVNDNGCGVDKTIATADDSGYGLYLNCTYYGNSLIAGNRFSRNGSGHINMPSTFQSYTTGVVPLPLIENNYGIDLAAESGTAQTPVYNLPALAENSATPFVVTGKYFRTANTSATSVTALPGGVAGKEIVLEVRDTNTTVTGQQQPTWLATLASTTWSGNLNATTAWDYFANTPAINDSVFWCWRASTSQGDYQSTIADKFGYVTMQVGTALNGTPTLAWEVWTGSAWTAVEAVSASNPFSSTGAKTVRFRPPKEWTRVQLSAQPGGIPAGGPTGIYYVLRAKLTGVSGVTEGGANATTTSKLGLIRLNSSAGNFGPLTAGQSGVLRLRYNGWWWEEMSRSIN